jgi:hypothetical protein
VDRLENVFHSQMRVLGWSSGMMYICFLKLSFSYYYVLCPLLLRALPVLKKLCVAGRNVCVCACACACVCKGAVVNCDSKNRYTSYEIQFKLGFRTLQFYSGSTRSGTHQIL